ncbi:MAG: LysM peptidoglycan-binding domain-containing protein [Sediminicola sp.]
MKKKPFKMVLSTMIMLFMGLGLWAQEFETHAVKQGETLESIAKRYMVTPFNILKYNKELKQGKPLKPNTILVIPLNGKAPGPTSQKPVEKQAGADQEMPIGFTSYKARRKDTLFGIAQEFHITVDDIKRYNKALYSDQLKKGMVLRIPKYKRVRQEESAEEDENLEEYIVRPKETRWSIVNRYGITMDSLLVLNPELSTTNDYLAEGQKLKLPKKSGSVVSDQKIQLYTTYTVPAKQTFYSLEKKLGYTEAEIKANNPEVKERGLQEGMVLRLPNRSAPDTQAVNSENFVFYEVKPKENEFRLTRKLNVTYKELLTLNPDLKDGLKAGMVLKIPKGKAAELEVRNSLILDKFDLMDSINTSYRPKLVFLLPFRLDKVDVSNKEEAIGTIQSRNDTKLSLGLYSGALVALDSIKGLGISVDVRTFDTQLSTDKVKGILLRENLNGTSAIIGPLDSKSLKEVAVKAAEYKVPVIAPISSDSDLSLGNVFFTIPTDAVLRKKMLAFLEEKWTDQQMVIIADDNNKAAKQMILEKFPTAKSLTLKNNTSLDIDKVNTTLSVEKENWVLLETDNPNTIYHVSSVLNSSISEKVKVRMFTTNKSKAFDSDVISGSHLSNLQFTYPSVSLESERGNFANMYRKKFGIDPDRYAVRGFDITFDILLKLAYKNNLFEASSLVAETSYNGNKFDYAKGLSSGYFNQAVYILRYENLQVVEAK